MGIVHSFTVRFADVDRAGVAFFASIFPLCHAAWEDILAQVMAPVDLDESFRAGKWPLPVVRAEANFRRPMRFGERLEICASLKELGARSICIAYTVRGRDDGGERAHALLTHAWVDVATGRSGPIDSAFAARLRGVFGASG